MSEAPIANLPTAEYLSIQEAAQRWGIYWQTIARWIREGKIPATRLGKKWRIKRIDVEAFELQQANAKFKEARSQENVQRSTSEGTPASGSDGRVTEVGRSALSS